MCAKKRCNNATALELPISAEQRSVSGGGGAIIFTIIEQHPQPTHFIQALKRPSECGGQQLAKRQVLIPSAALHQGGPAQQLNSNIARILSAASDGAAPKFMPGPSFGRSSAGNSKSVAGQPRGKAFVIGCPGAFAVPQIRQSAKMAQARAFSNRQLRHH